MNLFHLLVFYSPRYKNSLNALLGALQKNPVWDRIQIHLCTRESELLRKVAEYQQCLVLVSIMTSDYEPSLTLLKKCKTLNPYVKICVGGPHISADTHAFEEWADWLVIGEAEDIIQEIVQECIDGISYSFPRIYRPSHRVNLNVYPPSPTKLGIYGLIEITRGCPFECQYCQTSSLFGKDVRHRHQEVIFEYCQEMKKKDLLDIRFITPNALGYGSPDGRIMNLDAVSQLLKGIKKIIGPKGRIFFGSFPSEIRPEWITLESIQLLRKFTDNETLVIGAQTGSNRMLSKLHRGHTREQVMKATELAIQHGFKVAVDYIFGLPNENELDQKETLNSIQQLITMGAVIHAHSFLPLPGTQFAEAVPGPITPVLRHFLGKMARDGSLFGQWQTQEKLAQIMTYTNTH